MPFNSETYRANRYRADAWKNLGEARAIKARAAAGEAYDWEVPRIATFVQLARSSMRLHLMTRKPRPASRRRRPSLMNGRKN